jgi:imidazolonepropionase-like amidohydrolase
MNQRLRFFVLITLFASLFYGCTAGLQFGAIPDCGDSIARITAFTNVNLVPMTDEIILENQTVLIDGTKIADVGPSNEIVIPECATVVDGTGAYLMPGLADMHVHIYEESRDEYPISPLNLYIAKGVTTIRDCGTAPLSASDTFVLEWRDEIMGGETLGPIIYSSGRTIHAPVSEPGRIVRERQANGFDFVKLYMELSVEEFDKAQAAAGELGMYTVGHIPYQVGFDKAIAAGLDEIAHLEELSFELVWLNQRPTHTLSMDEWLNSLVGEIFDAYEYERGSDYAFDPDKFNRIQGRRLDKIIGALKDNDIPIGTTLATYEVVDQKLFEPESFLKRAESAYLPAELIASVLNGQDRHQLLLQALGENQAAWFWKRDLDIYILQKLHKAGVLLVSGTDAGSSSIGVVEGFATHDDLRILTDFGFTPYEALQTATVNAAYVVEKMTGIGNFGTLEVGKRADLVLLGSNPLNDINNTQDLLGVMSMGRWYPGKVLEQIISIGESLPTEIKY